MKLPRVSTTTRFLLLFCVCAVISMGAIAPAVADTQSAPAEELRDLARSYMSSQDYDKAIGCLLQLLAQKPADIPDIKADLGLCYKAKKDYAKALPLFAEVSAAAGPRQADVLFWTEDSLCEQGKMAEAVAHLTKVYSEHPELRLQVLGRRADRLEALGRPSDAIADLKQLIASYPNNEQVTAQKVKLAALTLRVEGLSPGFDAALDQAYSAVGSERNPELAKLMAPVLQAIYLSMEEAMWSSDKKTEAIEYLSGLLTQQPQMKPDVLTRLALRHEMTGKYKEACAELVGFVKAYPEGERAKMSAVKAAEYALKGSGDCAESQEVARWAQDIVNQPSDPETARSLRNELGLVFIRTGQFAKAEQLLQSVLTEFPDDKQTKLNLGLVYRGTRQYDKAMPLVGECADTGQGETQLVATWFYADCLRDQQKFQEAVQYLGAKVDEHPELGASLLNKRAIFLRDELGFCDQAQADFSKVVTAYPNSEETVAAELGIAELELYANKNTSAARELLQGFITKHPDYKDMLNLYNILACSYYTDRNYTEAAKTYEQGLTLKETGTYHPFFMYMAGDCYKANDETAKATAAWNKLIADFPNDGWAKHARQAIETLRNPGGTNE